MKNLLLVPFLLLAISVSAQTTHQVCVGEVVANSTCSNNLGVFTPSSLTIQQGDFIQFTTFFEALGGYPGTFHDIQFSGAASANNVMLQISTTVFPPAAQITTVTTGPFNTPGSFTMECVDGNHCLIAGSISGWSCTGYSVTVQAAAGCPAVSSFTASDTIICEGDTINFTNTSTGATGYEWLVDGVPYSTSTNENIAFGTAATYLVQLVADDGVCDDTSGVTIIVNGNPSIANAYALAATCFGNCDGEVGGFAVGGTGPYAYDWGSCSSSTCTGMCTGTYTLTVTDANNCTATNTQVVNEPTPLAITFSAFDATCASTCDGYSIVIPIGGTSPYTYLWCTGNTTSSVSGLCAGTCGVTVTDAAGCVQDTSFVINEPPSISANTTMTMPLCFDDCNGIASSSPSGGTAPYTFLWCNGSFATTATALCAGTCAVTITDLNGCAMVDSVNLINLPELIATIDSAVSPTTIGGCDGTATGLGSGGNPGYNAQWNTNPPQSGGTAIGLCAGTYCFTITDMNGCVDSTCFTITDPICNMSLSVTYNTTTGCIYDATVTPISGTPPYSYQWDAAAGSQTTQTATGLNAQLGNYWCVVTDSVGCQDSIIADLICTGFDDPVPDNGLKAYPNPTSGIIHIDNPNGITGVAMLQNALGQTVLTKPLQRHSLTLNATHLPAGIYLLRLESGPLISTRKLIIQK